MRIRKMQYDKRFDGIRESFSKFIKFWILQGLAVWIILIPVFFFMHTSLGTVSWFGVTVWLLGLLIESVADWQKQKF